MMNKKFILKMKGYWMKPSSVDIKYVLTSSYYQMIWENE